MKNLKFIFILLIILNVIVTILGSAYLSIKQQQTGDVLRPVFQGGRGVYAAGAGIAGRKTAGEKTAAVVVRQKKGEW